MVSEKDKDKKETSTKNQLEVGVLYPKNNQFYSYDGENFIQKDPEVGDKIYNFGTKTKYEYLGNDQFQELDPKLKKEEESWNQILTGKRSLAQTLVPGLGFMQSISAPVQAAITYAGKKRAGEDAGLLKPFVKGFVKGEAPEGEELTRGAIKLATGKKETAEKFYQAAEQELTKRRDATKQVYLDVFGSEKFANAMSKLQNPFGVQTIAEFATQIATDPTTWIMPGGLAKNKTLLKAAKEAALETKVADVLATQAEEPLKFVSTTAAGIQRTQPLAKTPFYSTAERPEMLDFLGDMAIDSSRIKPTPGTLEARASFIRRRPTEEAKKFPFLTQKFTEESIELPQDVSKRIVSPEFRTDTTPGAASIRERFAIGEGGQMYKETPPLIGGKERPEITAELNRRRGVISLKEKLPAGKERLLLPEHAESLIGKNLKDIGFKGTPEELAKQTKDIIAARNSVLKRVDDFKSSARVLGFDTKNIEKLSVNDFAVLESSLQKEMQNAKLGSGSIMDWAKYRPNIIAEELESYGSPLIQAGLKGSQNFNNYTGFGYRELGKFEEIMNKAFKNEGAFKSAEARIFDALENRANAFKILKSKAEVKAYEVVRKTFDAFKKLRSDRGLGVLDEYSPNINEQLDVMEGHLIDFEQSIQDFISKHSKHRVGSKGPVLKGLSSDGILSRYIASMSRELAYGDFLKLYREKGYNQLGQNYGFYVQDVVNDWIRGMVYPPRHDKMDKLASRIGAAVYDRYLSWNPGAAIQNLPQVDLAKMNITRSAKSFGNDLTGRFLGTVKEKLPANVKEYLKDIRKDVFSWTKEIAPESALKEESLLAKGIYGESEIYNWARARTWGRTQHLELSDIFKTELAKTKGDKVKAGKFNRLAQLYLDDESWAEKILRQKEMCGK